MAYYNYMSCSSCNMRPVVDCGNQCNKSCGCNGGCNGCCGKPILDIDEMPDSVSILRFNMNGRLGMISETLSTKRRQTLI